MILVEGKWYHESVDWASEMDEPETVRIDKIDTAESTVTLGPMKATSSLAELPFRGNRAERRRRMFRRT